MYIYKLVIVFIPVAVEACPYPDHQSDGWCDDNANIKECEYDGGDCCKSTKHLKPNGHLFCTNCSCSSSMNMTDRSNFNLKPGLCEFCIFPFINPGDEGKHKRGQEVHDCIRSSVWERPYCPMAVYKNTNMPVGIPFELPCPDGSCFFEE